MHVVGVVADGHQPLGRHMMADEERDRKSLPGRPAKLQECHRPSLSA